MEELKREKTLEELKKEFEIAQNEYNVLKETIKQKEAEEAKKKEAALAAEKTTRKKNIEEKEKELAGLIADYIKDYGSYNYYSDGRDSDEDIFSYLYHLFF